MAPTRDVRLLAGAVGASALGDFLGLVPVALYVQAQTHSGPAVAAFFVALWGPSFLLGGPAGALADRVESRRLLRDVSLAQAVLAAGLAATVGGGLAPALVLTALIGAGVALAQPAEFALVPAAAGGEGRLAAANGRIEAARALGATAGPALGGLVAAAGGTRVALLVDALSFVAVAGAAQAMRARRPPAASPPGPARGVGAALRRVAVESGSGIVVLRRDPELRRVLVVALVALLFMTACVPAELLFATGPLHAGQAGYGALLTAWTLGMVAGSAWLAPRVAPAVLGATALAAIAVQGAGLALPAVWLALPVALVAFGVGGAGHGAKNALVRTLVHVRVPPEARGRAWGAYAAGRNGAELIALTGGGLLVAALGPRWTLLAAGALPVLVVAGAGTSRGRRTLAPASIRARTDAFRVGARRAGRPDSSLSKDLLREGTHGHKRLHHSRARA
jgi:MFS family permease